MPFFRKLAIAIVCISLSCFIRPATAQEISLKNKRGFITVAPRVGVGIHNGLLVEGGLSAIYIDDDNLTPGAASLYATYFAQQHRFQSGFDIQGFKIGFQNSWALFMWGLEVKTAFYEGSAFTYVSPKAGLSWMDVATIEYLINIAGTGSRHPLASNHQIGIHISLNKTIYQKIWKPWMWRTPTQSVR
jgi:hypothetical protein